jgi:hypothetical protein
MEQPRLNTRGSIPTVEFDNTRRNSDHNTGQVISRSKSPLRNYKDVANNQPSYSHYNQTESSYSNSFSKTQASNQNYQKTSPVYNITNTEPSLKTAYKPSDVPRKFDGFKRAGSMQMGNPGEISKDMIYNFIPPQNLQTICNGNIANPLTQSYEKVTSSGVNTLTSAGVSASSYCKNCKRMEDQEKIMTFSLNQLLNQITDVADKEKLWRQGNISFEIDNFGWNNEDDQLIDPRILKKTDSGRILLEIKKQFSQIRKSFEEHIMDIENLSKTNLYKDAFVQKENRMPTQTDQQMSNPAKNLLTSIAEAKQCVESLRSTVFSEEIPPEIRDAIKAKNKQDSEEKNLLRTLTLQLEQSKRERRMLEIELGLQKKGILQSPNGINTNSLKLAIRQIIEDELRASQKDDQR